MLYFLTISLDILFEIYLIGLFFLSFRTFSMLLFVQNSWSQRLQCLKLMFFWPFALMTENGRQAMSDAFFP